ncbi:hypothetical protein GGI12_002409 [Dipsacomyces acuminosporus]|nr:hypothetical protein GGI12_002409 [Dipsacomyces acuminosporus]
MSSSTSDTNSSGTSATYNDVTRNNIEALGPEIHARISKARFIAIDTEFTGLVLSNASDVFRFNTSEWVTRATDMNDKYRAMANIAKTHALVSMGVSIFSKRHNRPGSFNVNNFNFTLQAQNSHLINPNSLAFLAQNGFDLGKQAMEGIRYFSGPNPAPVAVKTLAINKEGELIREVFLDIIRARVPLVVHNGLFDLVYIYQSFFGPLPDTYDSFAYDLYEMFPGGIYDTKFIAEAHSPGSASYLAYVFHRNERIQQRRQKDGEPAVNAHVKPRIAHDELREQSPIRPQPENGTSKPYCEQFAAHGHCRLGKRCSRSHDINFILNCQEQEQERAKEGGEESKEKEAEDARPGAKASASGNKRRRDATADEGGADSSKILAALGKNGSAKRTKLTRSTPASPSTDQQDSMYHTAAYDAYMTAYSFASYRILLGEKVGEYMNKVYLMGKPGQPLLIKPGMFSSNSVTFRQTMPLVLKSDQKITQS